MPGLKVEWRDGIAYATGTFNGKRIRKSLKTRKPAEAEEQRAIYEAKLYKRSTYGEAAVRTFEEAAVSYLEQGGEGRYVPKVLKHFKGRAVGSIMPAEIRGAALTLYPKASASTRNRQAVTPARSIINHAHDLGWCGPVKVKQFDVAKSRKNKPVDRDWMTKFLAESDKSGLPHLSACVLFMQQTGARISEAINLLGEFVDLGARVAMLEKTKTDEWSPRYLTAELVARMAALGLEKGKRVFGYTDRQAVNRRIKAVCNRAKIEPRSSHAAGRHSFATNAINGGARIKEAMDAGGWKSASLFMQTYVHSEEAGRNVAGIFDRETGLFDAKMVQSIKKKHVRFGKQKGKS
ncbi:tyrosine-type recombinase/integrase [Mesorhizobium sp. M0520]|uniref:tyrosine-type recombinase/integrase n=1 Tax=Mesorhizobium sp. M0520 TaxID=2956957 RepID=UPI00333C5C2D